MKKQHIIVRYERDLSSLCDKLDRINPDDIISVTERTGYTIIYRSNSPNESQYRRGDGL